MTEGARLLAVDPGFRATGWVALDYHGGPPSVIDAGVIRTARTTTKQHTYVADDDARCLREIHRGLMSAVLRYLPDVLIAETPAGSKSSRAAKAMGMVYAVVVSLAESARLPLVLVTAGEARKAAGWATSKGAVAEYVSREGVLVADWDALLRDVTPSKHEHVYDAAAVGLAGLQNDITRAIGRRT